MSNQTKFQATLNMIQTVPRIAESASQLHDNVMLCQLIAGARFGEDAAQDPELVFRLLDHLTEMMDAYDDSLIAGPDEPTRVEQVASVPSGVWGTPEPFVEEGESYADEGEERIAGAPVEEPVSIIHTQEAPPEPVTGAV